MFKIQISGVIGYDVTPENVRDQIEKANGEPISVEISSPGGFVFDGLEIFNIIRDYPAKSESVLMGVAASMASYIALATDTTKAHDNAIYMIHNAMSVVGGNHHDMRETADWLEQLSNHLAKTYAKKTGKTIAEIKTMLDADTWLFGPEMVESGFVDEIIETENEKDKSSAMINARAKFKKCNETMQQSEQAKNDLKKAAACIKPAPKMEIKKPIIRDNITDNNKISEGHKMTIDQLKAEHPDLYSAIHNDGMKTGAENEQKRVSALSEWKGNSEAAAKIVDEAISSGKTVNDVMAQLVKSSSEKAEDSSPAMDAATDSAEVETPAAVNQEQKAGQADNLDPEAVKKDEEKKVSDLVALAMGADNNGRV